MSRPGPPGPPSETGPDEPGTPVADGEQQPFGLGFPLPGDGRGSDSFLTVFVALAANLLVAVAKTAAALITRSASLTAEAAHSWADTGNEVFLVVANRRAAKPADRGHPLGHGREAYVWSLFAAVGLFVAGGAFSITHGVGQLRAPTAADDFIVGYAVLAVSFLLEGMSFRQSVRQARADARTMERDLIEHVLATSDPALRAVFAEDAAALTGLVLATAGLAARQVTGSAVPDAVGSILVGILLVAVAVVLINRNRRFLVGEEADPRVRAAVLRALLEMPEVARVTYLRLEVVGPRMISVIGDVDLAGDDVESHVAVRLRALEARVSSSPAVAGTVLSLSAPDEPSLAP
ncbi:cation diffusion facilitator family transporter [Catellatospora citrea]|uniref:Cation diffusion facilitator transporter n=1 Tax=Catellatospora citrea TaxID=53366 RepID=A0A8J3KA32_9ACTN|nr:cation diffusion facilitator family transporter [Catellatospora citrea]RKE00365.1 cation diffusion facilitator family transporter [Catellatospora citrea]GIF99426.1 cation diffusion facilitator transporter [Catellatospora citrea]